MEFLIKPYVGAGKILLGMTSEQIQEVLQIKPDKFKKFEDDEFDTDDFKCCHVYYKNPGICEAIEFFGDANMIINNKTILGKKYAEIKDMFEKIDDSLEFDATGLTSFKYGVGVYAPFAKDEPDEPAESVIVFEKGYYD
jgi:hypothetical protein